MATRGLIAAGLASFALGLGACGSGEEGGSKAIKWYVFAEPSGAYKEAAANCNKQAGGRYQIEIVDLPTNADQQRELVVRRLAAKDSDIDIIGMDVIWTAEFAQAEWIKPLTGANATKAAAGTLEGPRKTAEYLGKLWAIPFTSNTQLLWYRKDRVPTPPKTWDEMIAMAAKLPANQNKVQVQGARYEGLTVWFNSLAASAGGRGIVSQQGQTLLGPPEVAAAGVMKKLATSPVASASLSNDREDQTRLAFQDGSSSFMVNYPFVYPSAKMEAPEVFENMGAAPWPSVKPGAPAKVTVGGINLGVGSYSKNPELAFQAALCLAQPANQTIAAQKGGLPPTQESLYATKPIQDAYPGFANLLRAGIDNGVPRPVSPAYSDISLAIQKSLHPEKDIDPPKAIEDLRSKLDKAAEGGIF